MDEEVDRKAELLGKSVYPVGLVAFFWAKDDEMKNTNVTGMRVLRLVVDFIRVLDIHLMTADTTGGFCTFEILRSQYCRWNRISSSLFSRMGFHCF